MRRFWRRVMEHLTSVGGDLLHEGCDHANDICFERR